MLVQTETLPIRAGNGLAELRDSKFNVAPSGQRREGAGYGGPAAFGHMNKNKTVRETDDAHESLSLERERCLRYLSGGQGFGSATRESRRIALPTLPLTPAPYRKGATVTRMVRR